MILSSTRYSNEMKCHILVLSLLLSSVILGCSTDSTSNLYIDLDLLLENGIEYDKEIVKTSGVLLKDEKYSLYYLVKAAEKAEGVSRKKRILLTFDKAKNGVEQLRERVAEVVEIEGHVRVDDVGKIHMIVIDGRGVH